MGETLAAADVPRDYQPPRLVDARLGLRWGLTPGSAHQRRILVGRWCADVVHEMNGDAARIAAFLAPIHDAEAAQPAPALDADFFHSLQVADSAEDCARSAYMAHPEDQLRRRRFRHELVAQLARTQDALRALDQAEDLRALACAR